MLYGTGDPYSSGVGEAFAKAAEKLGLEVVDKESSSSADDTEYSAQLQKIQLPVPSCSTLRTTTPWLARTSSRRPAPWVSRAT